MIWQVQDDGHQFRIEVDYSHIKQIRLGQLQNEIGQLEIDVEPKGMISFSMRRQGIDQDWIRCGDFTESQQATEGGSHTLQGSHDNLRQSLLELISQAPDLAGKLVIIPDHHDFLCRDLTISPSATPEPIHYLNNHLFIEKPWSNNYYAPSFDQQSSWTYLNMLQQQANNNQVLNSFM